MTEKPTVLSVRGLRVETLTGSKAPIIHDIGFDAREGETLCVVGESGSGKSVTSLACMGLLPQGVLRATAGEILLDGEDVLKASPSRVRELRAQRVAMIFQEPMTALNPVQRVGRQIDEVLRLHTKLPSAERKRRILTMLERVRLPDVERIYGAFPHQLSGGQRQRIVIAMALILRPRLLLADEPTTALDVTTQKEILTLIKELQQEEKTAVVFVTHDFGVVFDIADRIVVVNRGRVVETGTRDEILAMPKQDYTRTLVSSVPSLIAQQKPVADGKTALEVIGLRKCYEERRLLGTNRAVIAADDVNITVRRGEITGIIGESGSGKSTVARCIIRLIEPTNGSIFVDGQDIVGERRMKPIRKKVQYIFQDPYRSLNPRRTIGLSLIEGLVNFGTPAAEATRQASEILKLVGLPGDVMGRYPHQFSGGQRQRIAIARALLMEPDVLIADEAVSALDVSIQAQVLKLFEKIREQRNLATLFITHDLRVAAQICNTIIVMEKGKIVEAGNAADVLGRPKHRYTQDLIAAAPAPGWNFQEFRPMQAQGGMQLSK